MALRPAIDPVVKNLLRALRARVDSLPRFTFDSEDLREVFRRGKTPFLQVEVGRDHLSLDLWLPQAQIEEARSSGIARAHPFLGDDAVKVRFERAEDLARVTRWVEQSYEYAPIRARRPPKQEPKALIPSLEKRLASVPPTPVSILSGPPLEKPVEPVEPLPVPEPVREAPVSAEKAGKARARVKPGIKAAPKSKAKTDPKGSKKTSSKVAREPATKSKAKAASSKKAKAKAKPSKKASAAKSSSKAKSPAKKKAAAAARPKKTASSTKKKTSTKKPASRRGRS